MPLICIIDVLVISILVYVATTRGLEAALPFFVFVLTLVPGECRIVLPGLFDLTAQRIATVTLFVLYLVLRKKDSEEQQKRSIPLRLFIVLILGWEAIAALNSVVFTTSLKTVLSDALDFYLLYYLFARTVTSSDTIHKILRAFVAALAVCCVFGWFEAYFGWKVIDLFPAVLHRFTPSQGGLLPDDGRVASTFPHPILFANALALGIPWALYLLTKAKTAIERSYLWIAVLLMFWNIYKTMSRGPWLALILSAILLMIFSQSKVRSYLLVISLLTVAVLVIKPGVWTTLVSTYVETNDPDSVRGSSYQYRYDLMHEGEKALADDMSRSLWGFGPGSFYYLHLQGIDPHTGHIEQFDSCDSAFVAIMVETGYIGLLFVLALLLRAMAMSWKGFVSLPKSDNSLCLIFLVNLFAFSFMMVSVMNWGWGQQSYMFWTVLALSCAYPRLVLCENRALTTALPFQPTGRFAKLLTN